MKGSAEMSDNDTNLNGDLEYLIQKSRPLLNLWRSDFEIYEFKLLDLYLSRINSDNPDKRTVIIEKGKIEEIFGVTRLRKEALFPQLEKLQTTKVSLSKDADEYNSIILFSQACAKKDDDGIWNITLTCSPEAMKYIFNLQEIGYIKYRLRSIARLTRTTSYILFNYLENYIQSRSKMRNSDSEVMKWRVPLDELKQMLRCDNIEYYDAYKWFNAKVLKKCHEEITTRTALQYDYAPCKRGTRVIYIEFTVYSNNVYAKKMVEQNDSEFLAEDEEINVQEAEENNSFNSSIDLLSDACADEFSHTQINELFNFITVLPIDLLPPSSPDDIDLRRHLYLSQKYATLNNYAKKSKIANRFAYLKKMIKQDLENTGTQSFSTEKEKKKTKNKTENDDIYEMSLIDLYSESDDD